MKTHSPWQWIPTLYFAEGLPYFIVNVISVTMFKRMGMSNGDLTLYTSLLYLPWTIKPLWSPFVDILKTKRWWILTMQALLTLTFLGLAFSLPRPSAAEIAASMVSRSRISPTRITSGSCRSARRNASEKDGTSGPISRWVMTDFLCGW